MKDGIIFTILLIIWTVIKLFFKLLWVIVKILATLFLFFGLYIPLFYAVFGIVLLATTNFTLGGMGTDQVLYYIGLGLCGLASVFISIRNLIVRPISSIFAPFLEYRDEIKKEKEKFGKEKGAEGENAAAQTSPYYDAYSGQGGYPPYGGQMYPPQYPSQYPPQYAQSAGQFPQNAQPYPPQSYAPRQPYDYSGRTESVSRDPYYGGEGRNGSVTSPYYGGQEREYPPYLSGVSMPQQSADRPMESPYPQSYPPANNAGFIPAPERPLIYYSKRRPGILVKEYSDRFELYDESDGTRRYIGTEYKDE